MRRSTRLTVALVILAAAGRSGFCLTASDIRIGSVQAEIFAPDWVWQKSYVNVLCVLRNAGSHDAAVRIGLTATDDRWPFADKPPVAVKHSGSPSETPTPDAGSPDTVSVPAGTTVRAVLPNVLVPPDTAIGDYSLRLDLKCEDRVEQVPYPFKVVRGPALPASEWMIFVLAGICLVWVALMAVVLGRFAARGAWKTPSLVFEADSDGTGDLSSGG